MFIILSTKKYVYHRLSIIRSKSNRFSLLLRNEFARRGISLNKEGTINLSFLEFFKRYLKSRVDDLNAIPWHKF